MHPDAATLRATNEPCVPDSHLVMIQERYGRPCPRVEVAPENMLVRDMLALSVHPRFDALFEPFWREHTADLTGGTRRALIKRLIDVMKTKAYSDIAPPPRNPFGA